jgi:hypothetical protein
MRLHWNTGKNGESALRGSIIGVLLFLTLPALFFPAVSMGADDKAVVKFVGKNWVNGRSWEKLDYAGKLGFVCGLFDGITLFWSMAESGVTVKKGSLNSTYNSLSIPASLTVGDVVTGMDEFYKDTANMPLPAICAYLFYVQKARGESSESIEKRLSTWRKMFGR